MKTPSKKANILALIIWIISIILAFKILAGSKFIWLPDLLLLLGFYPLLVSIRSPWLWLVFGLINTFVGIMLLLVLNAPKEELVRIHVLEMNAHVQSYHPYYVWVIIGILSTIIGLVQLILKVCLWLTLYLLKLKQDVR